MSRHLIAIPGVLSVVLLTATAASASFIDVTDIGVPAGFTVSSAFDFNSNGDVAVQSGTTINAFSWNSGTFTNTGNLGYDYAYPRGIDEDGTVVGMSKSSSSVGYAFKWTSGGGMTSLGTLGGTQSRADFINNGDIVGSSQTTGNSAWHAYVIYSGTSTMVDIGSLGGSSYAYKINDSGHVCGLTQPSGNRGFYYDGTTMTSIGTLDGHTASIAYGMNNSDVVVGYSSKSGETQAVYWTPTDGMASLAVLDDTQLYSVAVEINNLGQIIGDAKINVGGTVETHACVWNNGVITDLNSLIDPNSGWILQNAKMIDDNGTIVGTGIKDGVSHGFMLTLPAVPEPSSIALLATGLLGLLAYAWRKRK